MDNKQAMDKALYEALDHTFSVKESASRGLFGAHGHDDHGDRSGHFMQHGHHYALRPDYKSGLFTLVHTAGPKKGYAEIADVGKTRDPFSAMEMADKHAASLNEAAKNPLIGALTERMKPGKESAKQKAELKASNSKKEKIDVEPKLEESATSKKHYVSIAKILHDMSKEDHGDKDVHMRAMNRVRSDLSDVFAADNPHFDHERFHKASLPEGTVNESGPNVIDYPRTQEYRDIANHPLVKKLGLKYRPETSAYHSHRWADDKDNMVLVHHPIKDNNGRVDHVTTLMDMNPDGGTGAGGGSSIVDSVRQSVHGFVRHSHHIPKDMVDLLPSLGIRIQKESVDALSESPSNYTRRKMLDDRWSAGRLSPKHIGAIRSEITKQGFDFSPYGELVNKSGKETGLHFAADSVAGKAGLIDTRHRNKDGSGAIYHEFRSPEHAAEVLKRLALHEETINEMVKEDAKDGSTPVKFNIGTKKGRTREDIPLDDIRKSVEAHGFKIDRMRVKTRGGNEPTAIVSTHTHHAKSEVPDHIMAMSKELGQEAIAARHGKRGHLVGPKAADWGGKFIGKFFTENEDLITEALSKKTYVSVAKKLHDALNDKDSIADMDDAQKQTYHNSIRGAAHALSDYFAKDNPRFDRNRFHKAAGVLDEGDLNELSPVTLGRYIGYAIADKSDAERKWGTSIATKNFQKTPEAKKELDDDAAKARRRADKRFDGILTARSKLVKKALKEQSIAAYLSEDTVRPGDRVHVQRDGEREWIGRVYKTGRDPLFSSVSAAASSHQVIPDPDYQSRLGSKPVSVLPKHVTRID